VTLKLAEKLYAIGNIPAARELLVNLSAREHPSVYDQRIQSLKAKLTQSNTLRIGVLLPLMNNQQGGPVKSIAEEMLGGMEFALSEYRAQAKSSPAVVMDVKDDERDSVLAMSITREFVSSNDVVGIIGPLFSEMVDACAPVADHAGMPIISPTATSDGIAAIGPHVFQANPDFAMRGKAMARYAVQQLGYTSLAVLAPDEPMGRTLTRSFVKEAEQLGASLVAEEYYASGATDLREQFTNIRTAGLKIQGTTSLPDDFDESVTSIQGIFLPVSSPDELSIIASQMKYFNIQAQILGSGEWYDPNQLETHRRDLDGALFTSDWYVSDQDSALLEFRSSYSAQTKKPATRYTLVGYDVCQLLLHQIESGSTTREKLTAALSAVRNFRGLHSKITLIHGRVNSDVYILRLINGDIEQEMEVSAE
jgi:branched-chain amino acid transport system substrate-binding protein